MCSSCNGGDYDADVEMDEREIDEQAEESAVAVAEFQKQLKAMPAVLVGLFDPHVHKTMADFRYVGETALDLYSEGEMVMSMWEVNEVRVWLSNLS